MSKNMELRIKEFGKFKNKNFTIAPLTIFFGSNEAGKTTIHDAFMDALCAPGAQYKSGKRLRERYGEKRSVELIGRESEDKMDLHEFRSLRSIRGEDIYFAPEDDGERKWFDRLRAQLFHGGLDPKAIIEKMDKNWNSSRSNTVTARNKKKLLERMHIFEEELRKKGEERTRQGKEGDRIKELEKRIVEMSEVIGNLQKRYDELSDILKNEEKLRELKQYRSVLLQKKELENLKEKLEKMDAFREENLEVLNSIERNIESSRALLESIHAKLELTLKQREQKTEELKVFEEEIAGNEILSRKAAIFGDRIHSIKKSIPHITVHQIDVKRIVFPLGVLLFAPFFYFYPGPYLVDFRGIAAVSVLFISTVIFFLYCRTASTVPDEVALHDAAARIREDWRVETGAAFHSEKLDGIENEIMHIKADIHAKEERIAIERKSLREMEDEISLMQKDMQNKQNTLVKEQGDQKIFFEKIGAGNRDEFVRKLHEKEKIEEKINSIEEKFAAEYGKVKKDELFLDCERKIRMLEEKIVAEEGLSDRDYLSAKRENEDIREKIQKNKQAQSELNAEKSGLEARFDERLQAILETERELGASLYEVNAELKAIELNDQAAKMACEILHTLDDGSDRAFLEIVTDIGDRLEMVYGNSRPMKIKSLSDDKIFITDAAGEMRALEHLSKGTRDSFVFAARLSLLSRLAVEPSLIFLDEPFLTMDNERVSASIRQLAAYQEKNRDAVLVFTKEKRLCDELCEVFPESRVYDL